MPVPANVRKRCPESPPVGPALVSTHRGSTSYIRQVLLASLPIVISRQALAREGDYKMHPVRACVCAVVCHADFSKTATATEFL